MTTVSGSFTGVGSSSQFRLDRNGRFINVAISGTYDLTIRLQVAMSRDAKAWRTVETWDTADATVAFRYRAQPEDILRLNCTAEGETPGEATYSISDEEVVLEEERDPNDVVTARRNTDSYEFLNPVTLPAESIIGGIAILTGDGAPVDYSEGVEAGTGAGVATAGSLYIRTGTPNIYINASDEATPTWKLVTRAA